MPFISWDRKRAMRCLRSPGTRGGRRRCRRARRRAATRRWSRLRARSRGARCRARGPAFCSTMSIDRPCSRFRSPRILNSSCVTIGARPSDGSSSSTSLRPAHQRARDREHLLLAAAHAPRLLAAPVREAREHVVPAVHVGVDLAVAARRTRRAAGSRRRSGRRACRAPAARARCPRARPSRASCPSIELTVEPERPACRDHPATARAASSSCPRRSRRGSRPTSPSSTVKSTP